MEVNASSQSLPDRPILLATRGSALALAQANLVKTTCEAAFPGRRFEIKIVKTTGDKLQSVPPDAPSMPGSKGLFTKELEVALLAGEADLAVHSLKDLPTDLPQGLEFTAALTRADARDVLIYGAAAVPAHEVAVADVTEHPRGGSILGSLRKGATVATSSTRRAVQLQAVRPDLKIVPIRGNVGTRLQKLADRSDLDAIVLAAAGLNRLGFQITAGGELHDHTAQGSGRVPAGLRAVFLAFEEMLPCVGQAAIGIEGRRGDQAMAPVWACLNDPATFACVTAERSFLHAIGGGCLSPVAAFAELERAELRIRAVSFRDEKVRRTEQRAPVADAVSLGARAAAEVMK